MLRSFLRHQCWGTTQDLRGTAREPDAPTMGRDMWCLGHREKLRKNWGFFGKKRGGFGVQFLVGFCLVILGGF